MGRYAASHQTPAGTNLTIINVEGAAAARPKLNHFMLGSDATPANLAGEFNLSATTAAGAAGTTVTPTKLDPTFPTVACTARGGTMTEPTFGGIFLMVPLNQQATMQWWANPGFEPTVAVGTANGIAMRSIGHGGTPNMNLTMQWEE